MIFVCSVGRLVEGWKMRKERRDRQKKVLAYEKLTLLPSCSPVTGNQ